MKVKIYKYLPKYYIAQATIKAYPYPIWLLWITIVSITAYIIINQPTPADRAKDIIKNLTPAGQCEIPKPVCSI